MDGAQTDIEGQDALFDEYDAALAELNEAKDAWVKVSPTERIALLAGMKDGIMKVAEGWADTSARKKGLVAGTPIAGEEWLAGPYATIAGVNAFMATLNEIEGKTFVDHLPQRELATGQLGVKVLPHSIWDRLLLSGVRAEVWMQKGVTPANLKKHVAIAYDIPEKDRIGKVALVLGAGNVAAITPLDVLQKLLLEDQVVILKMNPINDYLIDFYKIAMKPFIDGGFLRVVKGDATGGAYLCEHPIVEELHITGSDATHDAIVWGVGGKGAANKKAGTPKNTKRFTSELGSVSPTIVVPGPWTSADIRFQAENIATMKLHNSGHNCIATQALVMPKDWAKGPALLDALKSVIASSTRPTWYPGAEQRLNSYAEHGGKVEKIARGENAPPVMIGEISEDTYNRSCEVFGPALGIKELDASDAESYLVAAIEYANTELWGTLGANILIHPKTIRKIGKKRFEEILAALRYGTIGVNGWCGLGFLITACPWGAFPGHTLENIGSGIGTVHNSFMLEKTEKTVIQAPWRPFPRGVLSGQLSILPRPPFFITNKRQHKIGRLLTRFQYRPSWFKLPRIFLNALLG
ncbi:aldehyde dehydrogenase (NAD(P)+) [Aliiroseovarius halocynthiae]|uniref:Aldehyde dehydrogenase family protein n=1 Tax=Aliiroseovarius halocynthiae TaxID=985055 RepID=A0A545SWM9_9RHOB|nr:aldehyde dehydrogenase family protein [Aliiroseovarius halocynthiae]TQV69382.1 aldehyde dehydrogenase family protein [Aliiroseovarius halocynthiae]SMR72771.1 aldehyde dehydrogenase (NAD(P)+) [Aliiroseovarius halocynthiae]